MKFVYKRSAAATALLEPEDDRASATVAYEEPSPLPAPAGALHRGASADSQPEPETYLPQRGSYGMRLHGGMPRGVAGRLMLGGAALAVLAALALAVAAVRQFLLHDPRFLITSSSEISVAGNGHTPRSDVLAVFGSDLERNIFKVPLGQRRADLERVPWVASATVMRLLPNRIRVQLTERIPVAFTRQGTRIGLVDASGTLLDMPPEAAGDPQYSFPVLTGLSPGDTPEVRGARMEVYRRFMADLGTAGPGVTQTLSEVDVTNPEDVKSLVTSNGADILVHFGDEDFAHRYREFEKHLPEWRTQYPRLASADMRYERQVVLEMQPGTNVSAIVGPAAAGAVPTSSVAPHVHPAGATAAPKRTSVAARHAEPAHKSSWAAARLASLRHRHAAGRR